MKKQWIEKNRLETPFANALYGAPSRYGFYCTRKDGSFCFHNFHATYAAKHFVELLIAGHDFKWLSKSEIITSHGMRIRGEYHTQLEAVIEYEFRPSEREWEFPEPYNSMFRRFAGLEQALPERDTHAAKDRPKREHKTPTPRPDNLTSLAEICAGLGIDPREARQALRKSNTPKPDHGWAWATKAEVTEIARIIKGK